MLKIVAAYYMCSQVVWTSGTKKYSLLVSLHYFLGNEEIILGVPERKQVIVTIVL